MLYRFAEGGATGHVGLFLKNCILERYSKWTAPVYAIRFEAVNGNSLPRKKTPYVPLRSYNINACRA